MRSRTATIMFHVSGLFLCSMLMSLPLAAQSPQFTTAELSLWLGKSIRISQDSDLLHIFDAVARLDSAILLPKFPKQLSVSPDGRFAAVLHEGLVSYVDHAGQSVRKAFEIETSAVDMSLENNKIRLDLGNGIVRSIDIATGEISALTVSIKGVRERGAEVVLAAPNSDPVRAASQKPRAALPSWRREVPETQSARPRTSRLPDRMATDGLISIAFTSSSTRTCRYPSTVVTDFMIGNRTRSTFTTTR